MQKVMINETTTIRKALSLKERFPFLSFFSDTEMRDFMYMVLTVSVSTAVEPLEILGRMSDEFSNKVAVC